MRVEKSNVEGERDENKKAKMKRAEKTQTSQYTNEIVMMTTDNELDEKKMHLRNGFRF
jgi:hypothetical protein